MTTANISIQELAKTLQGFIKFSERHFMKIEATLDDVFVYFNKIENDILDTNKRVMQIEKRLDTLESRFDGLESRFDGLERRFDGLEAEFASFGARLGLVEYNLREINDRLTTVERELYEIRMEQGRQTEEITRLDSTVKGLTNDVAEIYSRLIKLEAFPI